MEPHKILQHLAYIYAHEAKGMSQDAFFSTVAVVAKSQIGSAGRLRELSVIRDNRLSAYELTKNTPRLEDVKLSTRSYNIIKSNFFPDRYDRPADHETYRDATIGFLIVHSGLSLRSLLGCRNCGKMAIREIEKEFLRYGVTLPNEPFKKE